MRSLDCPRSPIHAAALIALLLAPLSGRASAGELAISVAPRSIALEPDARATIRIGAPELPEVSASVGRVTMVKAVGPRTYEATYAPPTENAFPQVAIIAVRTSRAFDWVAVPLAGIGEVGVHTVPNGLASLVIGTTRFGPVRADASGHARIRVVVPPGATHAMFGTRRVALHAPDVSHAYVTVDPPLTAADAGALIVVRAVVVTPGGEPRRDAPLELAVTAGQLSPAREVAAGTYEARWKLEPGAAGSATVTAALRDEPASSSRATVVREAGRPRRVRIESDRSTAAAGEGAFEFVVAIEDGAGNPVDLMPSASTDVGTFLGFTRAAAGRWTGRLAVPERIAGPTRLRIAASAGDVVSERSIVVMPGPAASIAVDAPAAEVERGSDVSLVVSTVDRFGNPTDEPLPSVIAARGRAAAPVRERAGVYRVVYHPPVEADSTQDDVTFRAGTAERVERLRLRRQEPSRLEVTPRGGIAMRTAGGSGPVVGGQVALWTRMGAEEVGLALDGSYFDFNGGATAVAGPGNLSLTGEQTYLSLTLSPSWRHALGSRARLWISAGGGFTRAHSMSITSGQPQIDEAAWVPTGTAAVSLGARLWGGYPFIELRGSYVADPGFRNMSGSFWPFFFQAGYRFDAF